METGRPVLTRLHLDAPLHNDPLFDQRFIEHGLTVGLPHQQRLREERIGQAKGVESDRQLA